MVMGVVVGCRGVENVYQSQGLVGDDQATKETLARQVLLQEERVRDGRARSETITRKAARRRLRRQADAARQRERQVEGTLQAQVPRVPPGKAAADRRLGHGATGAGSGTPRTLPA